MSERMKRFVRCLGVLMAFEVSCVFNISNAQGNSRPWTWFASADKAMQRASNENKLILSIVTGDDCTSHPTNERGVRTIERLCALDLSIGETVRRQFISHVWSAGPPARLFSKRTQAIQVSQDRIIIGLCDSKLRLLHLMIGVPTPSELREAIDFATIADLSIRMQDDSEANAQLAARYLDLLEPYWRQKATPLKLHLSSFDGPKPGSNGWFYRAEQVIESFNRHYLADISKRLKKQKAIDLLIHKTLNQHASSRQQMANALIVAGPRTPFLDIVPTLAESVWDQRVWRRPSESTRFIPVIQQRIANSKPVLIKLDDHRVRGVAAKSALSDSATSSNLMVTADSFDPLVVQLTDLATIASHFDWQPIDLSAPSLARFLLLEDTTVMPEIFRFGTSDDAIDRRLDHVLTRAKNRARIQQQITRTSGKP